jgi:cytochrome P450
VVCFIWKKQKKHLDLTQNSRSILKRLVEEGNKVKKPKHDDLLEMLLNTDMKTAQAWMNQLVDEILILFAAGLKQLQMRILFAIISF